MNFGYFDDNAREYVITRPDTPASWSNYLGTTEYGAIITNTTLPTSLLLVGVSIHLLHNIRGVFLVWLKVFLHIHIFVAQL